MRNGNVPNAECGEILGAVVFTKKPENYRFGYCSSGNR